ncbi:hypothetical protein PR048_001118 [Dryococelus australis]|uniref:Reverse transcriptase domain-containing protein n=1 Tax=Dryococelus australis TaxID=614101 RepID=A0ABQ9IHY3_9NEOP|nr:hypothetical protein PR048_001118 [Dryococelus australis]
MPVGLKCAPATFQNLVVNGLDGYIGDFAMAYLDDVLVWSNSWEEHLHHLSLVFKRLERNKLACKMDKCKLGMTKLEFLGQKFTLKMDNRCLVWLEGMHNCKSKLARWTLLLQGFVFQVEHVAGETNELADALSRNPVPADNGSRREQTVMHHNNPAYQLNLLKPLLWISWAPYPDTKSGKQFLVVTDLFMRNRVNAGTGKTPAEIVQGRELHTPREPRENTPVPPEEIIVHQQQIHEQAWENQEKYCTTWVPECRKQTPELTPGMYVYVGKKPAVGRKEIIVQGWHPGGLGQ